jgi:hypothetical protein
VYATYTTRPAPGTPPPATETGAPR